MIFVTVVSTVIHRVTLPDGGNAVCIVTYERVSGAHYRIRSNYVCLDTSLFDLREHVLPSPARTIPSGHSHP